MNNKKHTVAVYAEHHKNAGSVCEHPEDKYGPHWKADVDIVTIKDTVKGFKRGLKAEQSRTVASWYWLRVYSNIVSHFEAPR